MRKQHKELRGLFWAALFCLTALPVFAQQPDTLFSLKSPFVESSGDFGSSVSDAGDVNMNGKADVVVAAPLEDPGSSPDGVIFMPTATGLSTGTLTITSDDPDESTIPIVLQGEGLIPPDILVTLNIGASKDNTLYEDASGNLSNGLAGNFYVGRTGPNTDPTLIRRAVIAFNIAGNVPVGATITSVSLRLNLSRIPSGGSPNQTISLHRVTDDWGEGSSNGGGAGATAATNDATWKHRFFSSSLWQTLGGDFIGSASSSVDVGGFGVYTWGSTSQMVADVQFWVDNSSSNFGWLIKNANEGATKTARRFDSRENSIPSNRPVLMITYVIDKVLVNDKISPMSLLPTFTPMDNTFSFLLNMTNMSSDTIFSPTVSIDELNPAPPDVEVDNADNSVRGLGAAYDYSVSLGDDGKWAPGETTANKMWKFKLSGVFSFMFFANVFGVIPETGGTPVPKSVAGSNNTPFVFVINAENGTVEISRNPTAVPTTELLPKEFSVQQNYPNPFNPETIIRYQLPTESEVRLSIYNVLGQEVRTLVNENKEAGFYDAIWDGRDNAGIHVATGVYVYRLHAGDFATVKKLILLR